MLKKTLNFHHITEYCKSCFSNQKDHFWHWLEAGWSRKILFISKSNSWFILIMLMNWFCGLVDRRKASSFISSRDHCQRFSPSRISDTPRAGFEPAQNLSSGLVEWSCAVVISTTPRRHIMKLNKANVMFYKVSLFANETTRRFIYFKFFHSQMIC